MTQFDRLIFGSMLCGLLVITWWRRRHMHSVADFLIVGRKMRKYLGLSTGIAEGIGMVCIAGFLLAWGLLYKQQESILSYLYLTGAIFTAAGILTFVGLYWKRANPLGAYLVVGICMIIPMVDLIGKQIMEKEYPLKGHQSGLLALVLAFAAMGICGLFSKSGLAKWKNYGELVRLEDQQRRAAREGRTGPQSLMEL